MPSEGRKVAWAEKKFSDIWFGAPLGKLEASAVWKKCLEILMGGVLWESVCKVACEVARWAGLGLVLGKGGGRGGWEKCLEILMGGGACKVACEIAGSSGLGLVLENCLELMHEMDVRDVLGESSSNNTTAHHCVEAIVVSMGQLQKSVANTREEM